MKITYSIKGDLTKGKHCFVTTDKRNMNKVGELLGRNVDNLCIKVFYDQDKPGNWGDDKHPGGDKRNTTIKEATQIQNICWYHGLAPRVYKIIKVEWNGKTCDAQVTDYLDIKKEGTDAEAQKMYEKIEELGKDYGWKSNYREWKARDLLEGKFIDFQTFNTNHDYSHKIKADYIKYGTYGKKYYHNVPEFDLNGCPRKNDARVKSLRLNEIDFKGKKVIDLGMAGGWFGRYAVDHGATLVIGVDSKGKGSIDPCRATFLLNNHLGYYNIDIKESDLNNDPKVKGDIAFFFSMSFHVGVPSYLKDVADLVIVENNGGDRSETGEVYQKLTKLFRDIQLKGFTTDRNDSLPVYYCYK